MDCRHFKVDEYVQPSLHHWPSFGSSPLESSWPVLVKNPQERSDGDHLSHLCELTPLVFFSLGMFALDLFSQCAVKACLFSGEVKSQKQIEGVHLHWASIALWTRHRSQWATVGAVCANVPCLYPHVEVRFCYKLHKEWICNIGFWTCPDFLAKIYPFYTMGVHGCIKFLVY